MSIFSRRPESPKAPVMSMHTENLDSQKKDEASPMTSEKRTEIAVKYHPEIKKLVESLEVTLQGLVGMILEGAGTEEQKTARIENIIEISSKLKEVAQSSLDRFQTDIGKPEEKAKIMDLSLEVLHSAIVRGRELIQNFHDAPGSNEDKGAKLYELLQIAQGAMETFSKLKADNIDVLLKRLKTILKIIKPFLP